MPDAAVTVLLDRARTGDAAAFDRLVGQLYGELHAIARAQRRRLGASETVNTTAVVHEAYAKLGKLFDRLPQAGALIQVAWVRDADPAIDLEDHAAVSAAVEHILLGAQAQGLASYWATTAALGHPATLAWCGFDPAREAHLGCIWLGTAAESPPAPPRRPLSQVARFL